MEELATRLTFLWNDAIPEAPALYEIDLDFLVANRAEIIALLGQVENFPKGRVFV